MTSVARLQAVRRRLADLNGLLMARVRGLVGHGLGGRRLRPRVPADEGLEIAGIDTWDIQRPSARIDFGRLRCPLELFALAAVNRQIMARQFDPVVESDLWLLLDVSPSMRFPMRGVYEGLDAADELTDDDLELAKPSLMKRVAGAFMLGGFENGYRVRVLFHGPHGVEEGPALRKAEGHLGVLFDDIDRRFLQAPRPRSSPLPPLERVLQRVMCRKGLFLLVSDFMSGAYAWMRRRESPADAARCDRTLELLRHWTQQRLAAVARVNHWEEVRPPPPTRVAAGYMPPTPGDRCDIDLADPTQPAEHPPLEPVPHAIRRLQAQALWSARLDRAVAQARGWAKIMSRMALSDIDVRITGLWSRLVEV